jgi:uncharacterized coiled-coil protein SlyX
VSEQDSRLNKLEESQAFSERAGEQLSAQILELFAKIETLNRRLAAMEQRLERAARDGPGDENE